MPKAFPTKLSLYIKKILLGLFLLGVFLTGAAGTYLYFSLSGVFVKNNQKLNLFGTPTIKPNYELQSSFNILLLGYGGAGHDGGNLSDVLIVMHINPDKKDITLISVPRDLWVEIPIRSDISENHKINATYAIGGDDKKYGLKEPQYKGEAGGGNMAKKVVSGAIGMPVDHFVAVDFGGFKKIVDTFGGLDVDVPVTFDDYFYPIKGAENDTCGKSATEIAKLHELYSDTQLHHQFECRYENIHFDKGKNNMDGETALKFVRSRASAQHGGDFARSQRQQALLLAIKEKLISMEAIKKVDELFAEFSKTVRTDLDLETIKTIAAILGSSGNYNIKYVSLNEDNVLVASKSLDGQFILIPKAGEGVWSNVHKFILDEINK